MERTSSTRISAATMLLKYPGIDLNFIWYLVVNGHLQPYHARGLYIDNRPIAFNFGDRLLSHSPGDILFDLDCVTLLEDIFPEQMKQEKPTETADSAASAEQENRGPEPAPEQATKQGKKQRKGSVHMAVSQKEAAQLCGVSESTIRNWEKGLRMPTEYPGRSDLILFKRWVNAYLGRKSLEEAARGMDRAISVDPRELESEEHQSAWGSE